MFQTRGHKPSLSLLLGKVEASTDVSLARIGTRVPLAAREAGKMAIRFFPTFIVEAGKEGWG